MYMYVAMVTATNSPQMVATPTVLVVWSHMYLPSKTLYSTFWLSCGVFIAAYDAPGV